MSRTRRFLGGLSLGYVSQALVMLVALWLTPFLLARIGQHDYGLWLVATQLLSYLMLLDLGVVALLPRETAYVKGRAALAGPSDELPKLVGETMRLVLWQVPLVAVAALAVWLSMPQEWAALRPPMGLVLIAFVLFFPFRVFQAVLEGLQDLVYLGKLQIAASLLGVGITVLFVVRGAGLFALAFGWILGQIVLSAFWLWRVRARFAMAIPRRLPKLGWDKARFQIGRGLWISMAQVAQVLVSGTDLLIIGKMFGPAAVVPFAITGKLIAVLANQPHLLMNLAAPALSEMRMSESRERLFQVSSSLSLAMLTVSGLLGVVILAVNEGFVSWWVGPEQFGGVALTAALIVSMTLRHWNLTVGYTIFCFGFEKHLAITALLDGLVTVGSAIGFAWLLGPIGAPLGSILGVLSMGLRRNLPPAARETGSSLFGFVFQFAPWLWRFLTLAGASMFLAAFWTPDSFIELALTSTAVALVYILVMYPVVVRPPLGAYLNPRVAAIKARLRARGRGNEN
ncbi:MAG TPA: oligosaccharide flippase family protein [Thermoanaerobaculia bacterium]|nr:oligosaccharide flippase family protein [Thermoanaerobaculia bacterium]